MRCLARKRRSAKPRRSRISATRIVKWPCSATSLHCWSDSSAPLIFWLVKKDESPFMDHHGREAVNFHLTIMIAGLVCGALACLVIGFILLPLVGIASIVYSILAGVAANRGEWYRFPYTIRMIK